jgi:hypothetical protein
VINGNIESGGSVVLLPPASVTGTSTSNVSLTPLNVVTWTSPTPGTSAGDVTVANGSTQTLTPGAYGNLTVLSGNTVALQSGVYFFSAINLLPQRLLACDMHESWIRFGYRLYRTHGSSGILGGVVVVPVRRLP